MAACTCPSGDGSLRWPCPTHSLEKTMPDNQNSSESIVYTCPECGTGMQVDHHAKPSPPFTPTAAPAGMTDECGRPMTYWGGKPTAAPAGEAVALIERCRKALAEELAGWDIDPPLAHVKEAHDACVAFLAHPPAAEVREVNRG